MNTVYIYALKDPETNEIRYIGKTNLMNIRFSCHISNAKRHPRQDVGKWIKSLLLNNKCPLMEIVETCQENNWQNREQFWINHYQRKGAKLVNIARGGRDARPQDFVPMELCGCGFDKTVYEQIKTISKNKNISIGEFVRKAVDEYLDKNK